jgi:general secretion pathway protein K
MGASNFTYAEASWTQALADCSGAAVLASGNLSSGIFHICTLLIVVLWTLVLIAFIVAHVTASGRTEIRIANNLTANAVALAAVDGAIYEAIFNLSDPRPDQRWPVDGNPRELLIGHTQVTLRLEDEAWWINPNSAAPALVEALLRVSGSDAESARRLANAINEWVGSAPAPRLANAVLAEYQAAGLDYGPPAAPIETLDELGRVIGMTPAVLAAIRPHLTLFGPPEPNPASADPVVAAALAEVSPPSQTPNPPNQPSFDLLTVRIEASAVGPGTARVSKTAIARVGAMLPGGYSVLAWGSGAFN